MELTFKEIHGEPKIRELLLEHASLFHNLNERIEINELAEKLSKSARVIVAELEDLTVGFYAIYMNDQSKRTAFITLIGVDERYQGKGYGSALLNNAIGLANRGGYSVIKLEVNCNNAKAISLYKKLGFDFIDESTGRNSKFMVRSGGSN